MIQRHEFRAMGCRMLGIVEADEQPACLPELPVQLEEWEQSLSRFRSDSELCDLNRRAGEQIPVSQVLWDVFEAAQEAERETRGLVNPLILEAVEAAGYVQSFEALAHSEITAQIPDRGERVPSLNDVITDRARRAIQLPPKARLDFGGVAKGWAAHHAMLRMRDSGPALFNAGGDIAISGPREGGEPWEIGVDDPFQPGAFAETLFLEGGGVATSGKDYRHWMRGGAFQHHIINPRTGLPAETDVLTATVIAPNSMLAEAMAKAALISGSEAGLAWLDGDERLAGLLILDNGQRLYSRRLGDYQ